jgi:serine/threonine protein kinase
MTPERVRQIEELYHAAREDRAVLAKADPELRREVESLFAQDSSKADMLDQPAWAGAAGLTNIDGTATVIAPGTKLGSYKIEGPLGAGGMGEVFRALDTKLNRPVAIKFISSELADTANVRRFQREAQMASSLNHPHIVTVYDVGEFDGRQYLVTEYVDAGTLNDWSKEHKRTWKQTVELLTGVADGLAAAHQAAGLRSASGRAQRHLFLWCGVIRDARWKAAISRSDRFGSLKDDRSWSARAARRRVANSLANDR